MNGSMPLLTELARWVVFWDSACAMANTYTQIYIQIVFAVQGRQNLICSERKEELQKYMTGIVPGRVRSSSPSTACRTTRMS